MSRGKPSRARGAGRAGRGTRGRRRAVSIAATGGSGGGEGAAVGSCEAGYLCQAPDDVYRDNVLLRRVGSSGAVTAGTFYFDYAADRIYVGDDPSGHTLEAAAVPYAFNGTAQGVGAGVTV